VVSPDIRGIAAIGFTYLFGLESTWAHRLMVVTLAAVIGLVLFTIGAIGYPFSGGARIGTGGLRAGTGEVRDQQVKRTPIIPVTSSIHQSAWSSTLAIMPHSKPPRSAFP
jgi:hypothetical protein